MYSRKSLDTLTRMANLILHLFRPKGEPWLDRHSRTCRHGRAQLAIVWGDRPAVSIAALHCWPDHLLALRERPGGFGLLVGRASAVLGQILCVGRPRLQLEDALRPFARNYRREAGDLGRRREAARKLVRIVESGKDDPPG